MKSLRLLVLIGLTGSLLPGCSATNRLSMTVTEPAPVALPDGVQRVGLINRSTPSEKREGLARIDAVLSAEGMRLDSLGAASALKGLADRLRLSGRFEAVVVLEDLPEVARGGTRMPGPLTPEEIQTLCVTHGLDAVFSLAFYDTDTQVGLSLGMMEVPNELGLPIQVPAHRIRLNTQLRNGWRLYIPGAPAADDVMVYSDGFQVGGEGINPVKALESVGLRNEQVIARSRQLGYQHGGRLEPSRVRVGRDYFVRGTDAFARGKRLAQTGDWDGAAQLWEGETAHPKDKIAGRAHYNMAIINEIHGNLDRAIDWAREAYATYGTREALHYLRVLERRQAQQAQLEQDLTQAGW